MTLPCLKQRVYPQKWMVGFNAISFWDGPIWRGPMLISEKLLLQQLASAQPPTAHLLSHLGKNRCKQYLLNTRSSAHFVHLCPKLIYMFRKYIERERGYIIPISRVSSHCKPQQRGSQCCGWPRCFGPTPRHKTTEILPFPTLELARFQSKPTKGYTKRLAIETWHTRPTLLEENRWKHQETHGFQPFQHPIPPPCCANTARRLAKDAV